MPTQSHGPPFSGSRNLGMGFKFAEGRTLDPNTQHDIQSVEINSTQINSESAVLDTYFQAGFREEDSKDEDEELAGDVDKDKESHIVDNTKTHDALAWADRFILETRRKGGRQTENSVLKQWKVRQIYNELPSNFCLLYRFISRGLPRRSIQVSYPI